MGSAAPSRAQAQNIAKIVAFRVPAHNGRRSFSFSALPLLPPALGEGQRFSSSACCLHLCNNQKRETP